MRGFHPTRPFLFRANARYRVSLETLFMPTLQGYQPVTADASASAEILRLAIGEQGLRPRHPSPSPPSGSSPSDQEARYRSVR